LRMSGSLNNKLFIRFQFTEPTVNVGSGIVDDRIFNAGNTTQVSSSHFRYKFLLGIIFASKAVIRKMAVTVCAFTVPCTVGQFMKQYRVVAFIFEERSWIRHLYSIQGRNVARLSFP